MILDEVFVAFFISKNRTVAQQEQKETQSFWLGSSLGMEVSSQQVLVLLQLPIAPTIVGNKVNRTKNKANMLVVIFTQQN